MKGKICLVTGATSGIGKVTALELARKGATVVMVTRNINKGEGVRELIRARSDNNAIELLQADLADLSQVRRLAEEFRARHDRLDVLVNNAGLYVEKRAETVDGFEMTLAVNHLAPFLLTHLLLEPLKAAAPARIVTTSSGAHMAGRINFDDLQSKRNYKGFAVYSMSKLANVLFTYELAERLRGTGVTANCLHPGMVATNFGLSGNSMTSLFFQLARPLMRSPEKGAETVVYLASSPNVANATGKYFSDMRPATTLPICNDVQVRQRFWAESAKMVGITG